MFTAPRMFASTLLLCAGCVTGGGDAADANGADCPSSGRYFELHPGASWTYRVVDDAVSAKTQTVGALEDVGGDKAGVLAYRMTTAKPGGDTVVSWQEDTGEAILRHRELDAAGASASEEIYQPYRTRLDGSAAHTVVGASWDEHYTEVVRVDGGAAASTEKTETWTVVAVDERLTVPAGEFCTLRLRRTSAVAGGGGSDKSYWFARGVGKVQETGVNQIETLVSHSE